MNDSIFAAVLLIVIAMIVIIPIEIGVFKESMWRYIDEKMKNRQIHDRLKRDMQKNKK